MGGGTCYNGGWLPPGMTPPSGGSTTTPPAGSTSTTTNGCATPDPFAAMGGGACYNGGWLPPSMIIKATGNVRSIHGAGLNVWAIQANGVLYEAVGGVPAALRIDGLAVTFVGVPRPDVPGTMSGTTVIDLVQISKQ
jgi:hypothetical protein